MLHNYLLSETIFLDESLTLHNIPSVKTCSKPDIPNGVVTPNTDTVDFQSTYTVDCVNGYTVSTAEGTMTCQADNAFDIVHTCIGKCRLKLIFIKCGLKAHVADLIEL